MNNHYLHNKFDLKKFSGNKYMLKERIENITKSSEEIINIIGDIISNITSLEDEIQRRIKRG